jgi:hypothetical protein
MKNAFFFVCFFTSLNCYSQFTAGPVPLGPGDENLIAVRYRALTLGSASSQEEEFLGVPDVGVAANRVATNLVFSASFQMSFTYDAVANSITTVTTNGATVTTLTMPNISNRVLLAGKTRLLSQMNFLQINVRNQTPNSTTTVSGITLNTIPVPALFSATGNNTTSAYAFYTGYGTTFNLTASIQLVGSYGGSTEANRVEFIFGSSLAILPLQFDKLLLSQDNSHHNIYFKTNKDNNSIASYFLEASKNGIDFNCIDSTSFNSYTFKDSKANGNNYYRIFATSLLNQKIYSGIVKIKNSMQPPYMITQKNNTIEVYSNGDKIKNVKILGINGRVVLNKTCNSFKEDIVFINRKGIYLIQLKIGEKIYTQKITF